MCFVQEVKLENGWAASVFDLSALSSVEDSGTRSGFTKFYGSHYKLSSFSFSMSVFSRVGGVRGHVVFPLPFSKSKEYTGQYGHCDALQHRL